MIHLDTHVVVWLYAGLHDRIPEGLRARLGTEPLAISPTVTLELALLTEIGRLAATPEAIVGELERALGLRADDTAFATVVHTAAGLDFTRDPFDRLIAAQSIAAGAALATKDPRMLAHLDTAVWEEPTG